MGEEHRFASAQLGQGHLPRTRDCKREQILVDFAREYLLLGFAPLPIPAGEKGPAIRNWQTLRLHVKDLPRAFMFAGNLGLMLGSVSRELVDVDLDCEEARELADLILPPTPATTGRPSSPRSHRWYICPDIQTFRKRDPVSKASIVELRGTGSQTLIGPSIHPSGERYDFLDAEPAFVEPPILIAAVKQLAVEVIRARHGDIPVQTATPSTSQSMHSSDQATLTRDQILRRASAYLGRMTPAISGQGGHIATFKAAIALVHGFALSETDALDLLESEYNPRCQPAWSQRELLHKIRDAATKPHKQPFGWLLHSSPDSR